MADYEAALVDVMMKALEESEIFDVFVDGLPESLRVVDAVHSGTTLSILSTDGCRYHVATKSLRAVRIHQVGSNSTFEYRSVPSPSYT